MGIFVSKPLQKLQVWKKFKISFQKLNEKFFFPDMKLQLKNLETFENSKGEIKKILKNQNLEGEIMIRKSCQIGETKTGCGNERTNVFLVQTNATICNCNDSDFCNGIKSKNQLDFPFFIFTFSFFIFTKNFNFFWKLVQKWSKNWNFSTFNIFSMVLILIFFLFAFVSNLKKKIWIKNLISSQKFRA